MRSTSESVDKKPCPLSFMNESICVVNCHMFLRELIGQASFLKGFCPSFLYSTHTQYPQVARLLSSCLEQSSVLRQVLEGDPRETVFLASQEHSVLALEMGRLPDSLDCFVCLFCFLLPLLNARVAGLNHHTYLLRLVKLKCSYKK